MSDSNKPDLPEGVVIIDLTEAAQQIAGYFDYQQKRKAGKVMDRFLHEQQAKLTYGDTWVSWSAYLFPDDDPFPIFGKVADADDVRAASQEQGATEERTERRIQTLTKSIEAHLLTSITYSPRVAEGIVEDPHALLCWPLPKEVYDAVEEVGFDLDKLDMGNHVHLSITKAAHLAHLRGVQDALTEAMDAEFSDG